MAILSNKEKPIKFTSNAEKKEYLIQKRLQEMKNCNSSFKAVERETRNQVLASRTDPPNVGRYKLKYDLVEARAKGKVRYKEQPPNYGTINK